MKNLFCNKNIKRLLSCLMVLGMLVGMMPATYAAETADDIMTIISASDFTSADYTDPAREFQKMFYNSYGHNLGEWNSSNKYVMFFRTSADITYDGATHSIKWDEMNKFGLPGFTADSIAYGTAPTGDKATQIANAWKKAPVAGYYINGTNYRGIKRNVMISKRAATNPDYELNKYKYINFVVYSDSATNDSFNVTLGNTVGSTHTKKFTSTNAFSIDWEGQWKTISVPVSSFTAEANTTYDITDSSQNAANYFILTNTNPSAETTLYLHEVYMSVDNKPAYGVPACSSTAVTATINNTSREAVDCVLVAAVYSSENGPLEAVYPKEFTIPYGEKKEISVPLETAATTGKVVKGFLWDGLGTLVPLTPSTSYTVD